jgi:hypothetical protein
MKYVVAFDMIPGTGYGVLRGALYLSAIVMNQASRYANHIRVNQLD